MIRYGRKGLAAMAAVVVAGCAAPGAPLDEQRRLVAAPLDGRSVIVADGASPNVVELNGSRIVRLWESGPPPVALDYGGDVGAEAGNAYREGFAGTGFYVADIPPGSDLDDIPMHAQDSLDYIAVLHGEIDLVMPDTVRRMRQGDVLVQLGTEHSWVNPTESWCRLLVVVVTGER
ncbi:MAG: cupin domain-containing protein [Pseudomonadota bacterium]